MSSVKYKLTIAYDGGNYVGWQTQKSGPGVQQKIEEALGRLFPNPLVLHSSSRTDTGVHAIGMVAHVEIPAAELRMTDHKLSLAINAHLPPDIRIFKAQRCPADFHARFQATGKQYRYFVWNHGPHHPLLLRQSWHVPQPLAIQPMREAARTLLGRHDFRAFAANRNWPFHTTVRTLRRLDIRRQGPLLTFVIEGDGFLYRMCRGLVGTLVQTGMGRFEPAEIPKMLASRDRRLAGMSAPAHGLVLWKVFYGPTGAAEVPAGDLDE